MSGRFVSFKNAVVSRFSELLPKLAECEGQFGQFVLDDLKRNVLKLPAVRVAITTSSLAPKADGAQSSELDCKAYVICKGKTRDDDAWNIAEALGADLHAKQRWGLLKIGMPGSATIRPALTQTDKTKGVVIMVVSWKQTLHEIGAGLINEDGIVYEGYYIEQNDITDSYDADGNLIETTSPEEPSEENKPWPPEEELQQ